MVLSQRVCTVHTHIFTFYSSLERDRNISDMRQKGVLMRHYVGKFVIVFSCTKITVLYYVRPCSLLDV